MGTILKHDENSLIRETARDQFNKTQPLEDSFISGSKIISQNDEKLSEFSEGDNFELHYFSQTQEEFENKSAEFWTYRTRESKTNGSLKKNKVYKERIMKNPFMRNKKN